MKCIQCKTDNNLKDRTANRGLCKNCEHPFAFEPTIVKELKITDPFFERAIADMSLNNTLYFTPKQFRYLLDKRLKRRSPDPVIIVIFYVVIGFAILALIDRYDSAVTKLILLPLTFIVFNLVYTIILVGFSNSADSSLRSRKSSATALQTIGIIGIATGLFYSTEMKSVVDIILTLIIYVPILELALTQQNRIKDSVDSLLITNNQLQEWLKLWTNSNDRIVKLLPAPEVALAATSDDLISNSDVTDYSFDRLVVCNSNEIAQMLIANNFHFENNCAILSINGYPANIFDTVLQMLRRNAELKVYAFHDASPDGVKLVHELRTSPTWFRDSSATIIDLGLLPRQVIASSRSLFIQRTPSSAVAAISLEPEIRLNLSVSEFTWLDAGNYVELESFTPQRLIKILNRGISSSQELATSDWMDSNAGNRIYAVESFG
jgi:hypothetical protein